LASEKSLLLANLASNWEDLSAPLFYTTKTQCYTYNVTLGLCAQVPDYYDIIKKPMDLSTVMANIDLHKYNTAASFLEDIFLICSNALEYNPDRGPTGQCFHLSVHSCVCAGKIW
jgi:hypothetical protein